MQTYHKHGMGEVITLVFEVTSNGAGITGQTPVAAVRKKSNGQWLDDAKTAWQAGYNDIAMAQLDATNLPGVYTLDITHIDITSEEYQVYFKNTGTYAGVDFESHIFTGAVYVPPSSSYATGTVRGLLNIAMNKDGSNTYSQATDSLEALSETTAKDATVAKDSTVAKEATLTNMKGATFDTATDSLEALRNRGDAAWITATGFSTHTAADTWAVATRVLTAGTNIVLAKGTGVTGFNDLSAVQVNTECDTALTDYDPPTRTEATADKDAIIVQVDANETKIDGIKAKTDTIVWSNITDTRDEALGKWVLDPVAKTLTLYRVDGVTVLKVFNLGDTVSDVPVFISRTPV